MSSVLRPMLAICDRLRTGMRLAVLVVVLLVPGVLTTAMYAVVRGGQISFSVAERSGADVVQPVLQALAATAAGAMPDLDAVHEAARRQPALGLTKLADALPRSAGAPAERLALGEALAAIITEAGNTSNLILDPDLDSFYVMDAQIVQLPKALVAGLAAGVPATGTSARDNLATRAVLAGTLTSVADSLRSDTKTAAASSKQSGLGTKLAAADQAADAAAALGKRLTATSDGIPSTELAALGIAARDGIAPLHDVLVDLLNVRIGGFTRERSGVLGIAVGGIVLADLVRRRRGPADDTRRQPDGACGHHDRRRRPHRTASPSWPGRDGRHRPCSGRRARTTS